MVVLINAGLDGKKIGSDQGDGSWIKEGNKVLNEELRINRKVDPPQIVEGRGAPKKLSPRFHRTEKPIKRKLRNLKGAQDEEVYDL